jgi:hypothetical protein
MKWTKELPATRGHYWIKCEEHQWSPVLVSVLEHADSPSEPLMVYGAGLVGPVQQFAGSEWSSALPVPDTA